MHVIYGVYNLRCLLKLLFYNSLSFNALNMYIYKLLYPVKILTILNLSFTSDLMQKEDWKSLGFHEKEDDNMKNTT